MGEVVRFPVQRDPLAVIAKDLFNDGFRPMNKLNQTVWAHADGVDYHGSLSTIIVSTYNTMGNLEPCTIAEIYHKMEQLEDGEEIEGRYA
tara:strand:- start:297 stop:566 length:270 start_codon:yes stop_codon:yes gene_type:complete